MYLDKFVNSQTGKYVMSILLGIGLATLFRAACKGKRCRMIRAAPLEELDGQIYKFDGKCYRFDREQATCSKDKKIYKMQ
jgi:hypothetical protein